MGGCRCSFRSCTNNSSTKPGYHFFHFPIRDEERLKKWADFASKSHYLSLPSKVLRNKVVCADHFTDNCFMNSLKDRLTKFAVPTLLPLATGDILDFSQSDDFDGNGSNDENKISANIHDLDKIASDDTTTETEIFYLEQGSDENASAEQADVVTLDMTDESIAFTKVGPSSTNILNGNRKRANIESVVCSENEQTTNVAMPATSTQATRKLGQLTELKLRKVIRPKNKKLKLDSPLPLLAETANRQAVDASAPQPISTEEHQVVDKSADIVRSAELIVAMERVASRATIDEFNSLLTADRLSKIDSISNHGEQFQSTEKCVKDACAKLSCRLNDFQTTCLNQLGRIEKLQNRPITVNAPSSVQAAAVAGPSVVAKIEVGAALSKAHLFNGIKKYLNPSMVSLLRMEMFGCSERPYKVDEKNFAMELYELKASNAYEFMRDEWRFRLPPKKDVEQWIKERDQAGNNSIDWDDC